MAVTPPLARLPSRLNVAGAHLLKRFHEWRKSETPISPAEVEMGEHWWYVDSSKARRELGFSPRDPQETLHQTVRYLDQRFRAKSRSDAPTASSPPERSAP